MSVLRRVKLRTPDGIESIEYPLGVEARNVEVANQENLSQRLVRIDEDLEKNEEDIAAIGELAGTNKQNIGANEIRIDALERRSASIEQKPYYFDTVADMKAYQGLKVGDMVITLGYYEANDGGDGEYIIVDDETLVEDGSSIHILNNGLRAKLIIIDFVNAKQFGAYGDNTHDDSDVLQKGIEFCESSNFKTLFIPKGTYYISKPIKTHSVVNAGGDGTGNGITIKGENGTILNRKVDDITPPSDQTEDFENSCLAICGNNNIISTLHFSNSKVGLYIGQDSLDSTGETNAHFNKINNILCNNCGIGIDFVAGYGNYYNNIDNFKIYNGNIGIDYKKYNSSSVSTDVSNRNNLSNGAINKCYAGIRITSPCDTNMLNNVHFEQISTTYGVGTKPSWLPNNNGVALFLAGSSNMVTNCVCESCDLDLKDNGYDNRYILDVFNLEKVDFTDSQYLGTCIINTASSNGYFNKLGSLIQQSAEVISGKGTWNNEFDRPIVSDSNIFDKGFNAITTNLSNKVNTTNFTITNYIGGTQNYSNDNVYYHKRIGKINHLYVKGAFIVDSSNVNDSLKINLPASIVSKFGDYSNRVRFRTPVLVNNEIVFAFFNNDSQLVIPKPSGGWISGSDLSTYNTLDVSITYPSE